MIYKVFVDVRTYGGKGSKCLCIISHLSLWRRVVFLL